MSWRTFKTISVVALTVSAMTLTHSVWAKGSKSHEGKSFKVTGIVKSVSQNSITLEQKGKRELAVGRRKHEQMTYAVASNVTVKSGNESLSLSSLAPGTRVRLQGMIGAGNARTVNEIFVLPAKREKSKNNATASKTSTHSLRQGGRS